MTHHTNNIFLLILILLSIGCSNKQNQPIGHIKNTLLPTVSLLQGQWSFTYKNSQDEFKVLNLIFLSNGQFINTAYTEKKHQYNHWKIDKNKVIISFNKGFSIYTGYLINNDYLLGTATNRMSFQWKWQAKKVK